MDEGSEALLGTRQDPEAREGSVRGAVGRRAGWSLADQAVSSATNFAITLFAARSLSIPDFGAFGLIFAMYVIVLGIVRAISAQPLLIRYSTGPHDRWRTGTAEATGTAAIGGLVLGALTTVIGIVMGGDVGNALIVLGIFLPLLLVQDMWRFALFADARPAAAFVNDLTWGMSLIPILGFFILSDRQSASWFFGAWGTAGSVAALVGLFQVRVLPSPRGAVRWLRRQADLAAPLTGEFLLSGGVEQLVLSGVGLMAGLSAVAALRGAEALFGPLNVLVIGLGLIAVPEGARMLEGSHRSVLRLTLVVGAAAAGATVMIGVILLSLSPDVGSSLLGATWTSAAAILVPVTVARLGTSFASGAMAGLRALGAGRSILMVRVKVAPLIFVAGVGGATITGTAWGAAVGIAVAQLVSALVAWRTFLITLDPGPEASDAGLSR